MRDISQILRISEDDGEVIYLGYPLSVTATEKKLLKLFLESDGGISSREICEAMGLDPEKSRNAVAVHVCHINNKSLAVGGRRLISDAVMGVYRINEFL
jgi:DNA-binding response OmpR family regulator